MPVITLRCTSVKYLPVDNSDRSQISTIYHLLSALGVKLKIDVFTLNIMVLHHKMYKMIK